MVTAYEIAEKLCGALETHHMEIEGDVYYFVEWFGNIIDLFNSEHGQIPEAREELARLEKEFNEWYEELE